MIVEIGSSSGIPSDKDSVESGRRARVRKEFLHRFVDGKNFRETLTSWLEDLVEQNAGGPTFDSPFERIDLQKFDYALEGVPFQQLVRMPSSIYEPTSGAEVEGGNAFLALEDFMHASASSLWEAFWGEEEGHNIMPFYVSSLYERNLKFYPAEKVLAKGKTGKLCASAIMLKNPRHPQGKWDDVVELALLRPGYYDDDDNYPHLSLISDALFFALRVLIARSVSRSSVRTSLNYVFVLVLDSQYGSVVRVEGDLNKMDFDLINTNNVYKSAASWFKNYSRVAISPVERIWNKLGNANWGDVGALQALYATFHSIVQFAGMPKNAIEDLAAEHGSRLQARKVERNLTDKNNNNYDNKNNNNNTKMNMFQHRTASPEIVEVREEFTKVEYSRKPVKLEVGDIVLLEDSDSRNDSYRVNKVMSNNEIPYYVSSRVENPGEDLFLYAGPHPTQMEPAWEDMKLWYQVQRQTKVLSVMREKGVSSKYLPEIIASGRAIHPGSQCRKSSSSGCDHPWCGTPVLVTGPVGMNIVDLVKAGKFTADEAIKCCHNCLSALSSAGVRHGDIRPENIIRVKRSDLRGSFYYYVVIGWGHAILEERDRPAMNLHFSSTSALQEGKLCSASDAESLVYTLYFSSGGDLPELDSVEGALVWRENSWSRRLIQQKLGDISAVLKAFADYVDSLCGTPYPVDYEIWLRRLRLHVQEEE
ncbi:protein kinase superfamily protein [Striga asiatica]|uniref:Protein kinase superfamily protein n=1 Tax=Striga asiatica TaxID=4170 RepID=A0A5A7R876_STRAF|nr:protein kinase superfamily protein [Striga asiatica]